MQGRSNGVLLRGGQILNIFSTFRHIFRCQIAGLNRIGLKHNRHEIGIQPNILRIIALNSAEIYDIYLLKSESKKKYYNYLNFPHGETGLIRDR